MIIRPPYRDASDAELAAWSAGGDRYAFDEIVTRHGAFAIRIAERLAGDAATAEDLAQDALVRAWHEIGRYDPVRGRFTTWLYRIVVNRCIDDRRKPPLQPIPQDYEAADPAPAADDRMARMERDTALAKAMTALPVRQRAAMTLVYDEELSGAEAARVLGLSAKAVERLLARARAFLRARLLPERAEPEYQESRHRWKET